MSEVCPQEVLLLGTVGSRAYGMATEDSDEDLKGVCFGPVSSYLGFQTFEQWQASDNDTVVYELRKFCKLALNGNPTILEVLFLPEYKEVSEAGQRLLEARKLFLSKRVRQSYCGFAVSCLKNAEKKDKPEKQLAHCLRLLKCGLELYRTGHMTVDRTARDAQELLDVRAGKVSLTDAWGKAEKLLEEFDKRNLRCVLPDEPDTEKVEKLVQDLLFRYLVEENG